MNVGCEACHAILQHGVRQFGFTALDAVADPDNTRSKRLLAKLEFEFVGPIDDESLDKTLDLFRFRTRTG